jgi:4-deoxy-L-threo-5-hexosulose-uronate ketol-isomerase
VAAAKNIWPASKIPSGPDETNEPETRDMNFESRFAIDPAAAAVMGTAELRHHFHVGGLFMPGHICLTYTHYDRMILGGAMPSEAPLRLEAIKPTGTATFLARRELIAVNIGGSGVVEADGDSFDLASRDMIYVGMGTERISFASADASQPAKFYLVSAPAHQSHPTTLIRIGDAKRIDLGNQATSNERSIFQFIHPEGARTCQLVVGMTQLAPGSIWNTMPCHVHDRRSEAYLYFDLADGARVFHFMGEPDETRHLVIANEEAILSPGWSIHSGAGTSNYAFIWAMAGDNVDYTDVDAVAIGDLR